MAADGSPEAPIPAVRVDAPAAPIAAAPAVVAEASALLAPVIEAGAAAAPVAAEPKIELVAERPSLLESFGKDKPAADKPAAETVKPEAAADKPKGDDVKPAEAKPAAEGPKDGAKPVEAAKPEGEVKPPEGEAKPAEPVALVPIEYAYELPPTLKMDDALKGEVATAFDAFRADPGKGAQALIDLHAKTMADYAANLANETLRNQHKAFNDTRAQWNIDWAADPEIGGAGYQTATRAIARMRDQFVSDENPGTPKYQADFKAFEDFLRVTGAGDHPAFGRFLHNVARAFDEPSLPPANPKPAPNRGQQPGNNRAKMYGPSSSKAS